MTSQNPKEREQPGRCDSKIYEKGKVICVVAGPRSWLIEDWVVGVRAASKQQVDWHFIGGRAVVLYLGNYQKVRDAIEKTLPLLETAYRDYNEDETLQLFFAWSDG